MPTYKDYVKNSVKKWDGPKGYLGKFSKLQFLAKGHNTDPITGPKENCDLNHLAGSKEFDACVARNKAAIAAKKSARTVEQDVSQLQEQRDKFKR